MTINENPKINNTIFKELIKRGYTLDGNTRIWNISHYKFWFLTSEQAEAYLDLENSKEYNENIIKAEKKLMEENTKKILGAQSNEHYNLIDLGCNKGLRAITIIKALQKNNNKIKYCPIDFSGHMVKTALKNVSDFDTKKEIEYQWNVSHFENIDNIIPLLRFKKYQKNIIMLLRNVLGNFEINELLSKIRSTMDEGDILIIGNGLDNENEKEMIETYKDKKVQNFLSHIIKYLGINPNELEYESRFINSRIENYFKFKKDTTIKSGDQEIAFKTGDKIIVSNSYKYKKHDFLSFLNLYFDQVETELSENQNYIIAFCKK